MTNIENSTNKWPHIKNYNNISDISIILYSIYNGQIYLLLGTESNTGLPNKTDVNLVSNFRGKIINDESIPQACGRILFEKTMNMVIDPFEFEKLVSDFQISYFIKKRTIIILHKVDYLEHQYIPKYYDRLYKYLMVCTTSNSMNNWVIESCPVGFLDKSDLCWRTIGDFIKNPEIVKQHKQKFLYELMLTIDIMLNKLKPKLRYKLN